MEYHTKNTTHATYWCKPCGKGTLHTVAGGRKGACTACLERLEAERKKPQREPAAEQKSLFG